MNWETIIQTLTNNWAELGITGVGLMAGFKWFITDKITQGKNSLDYNLLRSQVGTFDKSFGTKLEVVFNKVETLSNLVQSLTKENAIKDEQVNVLSNLVVEALSVANVPLANKDKFYAGLNQVSIINANVSEALKGIIDTQKETKQTQDNTNQVLMDSLKGV